MTQPIGAAARSISIFFIPCAPFAADVGAHPPPPSSSPRWNRQSLATTKAVSAGAGASIFPLHLHHATTILFLNLQTDRVIESPGVACTRATLLAQVSR